MTHPSKPDNPITTPPGRNQSGEIQPALMGQRGHRKERNRDRDQCIGQVKLIVAKIRRIVISLVLIGLLFELTFFLACSRASDW